MSQYTFRSVYYKQSNSYRKTLISDPFPLDVTCQSIYVTSICNFIILLLSIKIITIELVHLSLRDTFLSLFHCQELMECKGIDLLEFLTPFMFPLFIMIPITSLRFSLPPRQSII